jgi:transposase InsO family protein
VARLRIPKSTYYDQPKVLQQRDELAVKKLLEAHTEHQLYGVERLALELGWSKEKTRRIRNVAGIVIPRASKKHKTGKSVKAEIQAPVNALKPYATFRDPDRPQDGQSYAGMVHSGAWVQDFTYLWFGRYYCYLAVVLDLATRQILGWQLGLRHSSELTYAAVVDALSRHLAPAILHSDQGSEYLSYKHQELCGRLEIILSCSDKASPWQNGYMERFMRTIQLELGPLNQYQDLPHLHEAVARAIYYYNHRRIHTALKMSPADYAAKLRLGLDERELVSGKTGG